MPGLLDLLRRAAPGEAPVDPLAGSVMSPGYIPETDKRQLALGGLRGLLDVSPVGMLDAATSAINRANLPSLAAVRAVTGRQALLGDALVGLLGQGGGAGYDAARSATQAVVPMMGLLGNQSAGALPAGYARDQSGAIVWHGSPHKFDKFDAAHIGKGEGAQAYGHGLYFAENPSVARSYMRPGELQQTAKFTMDGRPLDLSSQAAVFVRNALADAKGDATKAMQWLDETASIPTFGRYAADIRAAKELLPRVKMDLPTGHFYKVDLPDDAIARMLDWDKPLSQQPEAVRKAMERSGLGKDAALTGKDVYRKVAEFDAQANVAQKVLAAGGDAPSRLKMVFPGITDAQIAQAISRAQRPSGDAVASSVLRDTGLTGIRYLDGGSRGAGAGSSNYVVFPGEEGLLKILSRE